MDAKVHETRIEYRPGARYPYLPACDCGAQFRGFVSEEAAKITVDHHAASETAAGSTAADTIILNATVLKNGVVYTADVTPWEPAKVDDFFRWNVYRVTEHGRTIAAGGVVTGQDVASNAAARYLASIVIHAGVKSV
jgi:hypothetical protein